MNIPKKYLTETLILIEEVHKVNKKRVLEILTKSKPVNENDPNINYYNELADWAEANRDRIKKEGGIALSKQATKLKISDRSLIDTNPRKLQLHYGTIVGLLETLWELMQNEGHFGKNEERSDLIQKTTLEILAGLSNKKPPEKPEDPTTEDTTDPQDPKNPDPKDPDPEEPPAPEKPAVKIKDWTAEKARRLANPNGKQPSEILEKFYNDYYSQEYASIRQEKKEFIINKLKSLNEILVQEFDKLGYNADVNPLAQFLKLLIKHKFSIFENLNTNNYGAIHNSFIRHHITGNMLGNYKDNNILFCDDLYNYKGLTIVHYLDLYEQTINKAKQNVKYQNDPELLAAKIFVEQPSFETSTDGEYKTAVDALLKANDNIVLLANPKAKLRSETGVAELFHYTFKESPETSVNIDTIITQAYSKGIQKALLLCISEQTNVIKAVPKAVKDAKALLANLGYDKAQHERELETARELLAKY
jgi:hypothetical protein